MTLSKKKSNGKKKLELLQKSGMVWSSYVENIPTDGSYFHAIWKERKPYLKRDGDTIGTKHLNRLHLGVGKYSLVDKCFIFCLDIELPYLKDRIFLAKNKKEFDCWVRDDCYMNDFNDFE